MKLEDLKIIVSGGAQGMGRHFAVRLAEAGAQVAIADVNEVGLAETVEAAKGAKGKIHAKKLDVSKEDEVGAYVEWAHGALGGLNGIREKPDSGKQQCEQNSHPSLRYPAPRGYDPRQGGAHNHLQDHV